MAPKDKQELARILEYLTQLINEGHLYHGLCSLAFNYLSISDEHKFLTLLKSEFPDHDFAYYIWKPATKNKRLNWLNKKIKQLSDE